MPEEIEKGRLKDLKDTYKSVLVLHGPNLNLLGERETDIYGRMSLNSLDRLLQKRGESLGARVTFYQSNCEGALVDKIHEARRSADGILINPAALTHNSYSIRDALAAVTLPVVEVHLSNIYAREPFRTESVISPVAAGVISGLGPDSYLFGLEALVKIIKRLRGEKD